MEPTPESIDPDNRLLWHMPLRRLQSESVRDAILLAVHGRFADATVGGPPGCWEEWSPDGRLVMVSGVVAWPTPISTMAEKASICQMAAQLQLVVPVGIRPAADGDQLQHRGAQSARCSPQIAPWQYQHDDLPVLDFGGIAMARRVMNWPACASGGTTFETALFACFILGQRGNDVADQQSASISCGRSAHVRKNLRGK